MRIAFSLALLLFFGGCGSGVHLNSNFASSPQATQLVLTNFTSVGIAGVTLPALRYVAQDAGGNSVANWNQPVSLRAYGSANCAGAPLTTISGAGPANPNGGTASFPNLQDSRGEVIYLQATSGGLTSACSAELSVAFPGTVSKAYPVNGSNWNDYVKNNNGGTSVFNQPDVACTGGEAGNYFSSCIHGGEKKKITFPGYSSCSGLTAKDALGAFNWICDATSGTAVFYSLGLADHVGLAQLINAAGTAFLANSFSVYLSGHPNPILSTSSSSWWSNTVQPAPSAAVLAQPLSVAGTIYVITASGSSNKGYNIAADHVGLVTAPGVEVTIPAGAGRYCTAAGGYDNSGIAADSAFVCGNATKFAWIEASSNISAVFAHAIFGTGLVHWRIHNSKFRNGGGGGGFLLTSVKQLFVDSVSVSNFAFANNDGIDLNLSNNNIFSGIRVSANATGIDVYDSSNNVFSQIISDNNGGHCLWIEAPTIAVSHSIILQSVSSNSGNSNGIYLDGSAGHTNSFNTVLGYSGINNYYSGLALNLADHSTIANILVSSGGANCLADTSGSGNLFEDILAANCHGGAGGSGLSLSSTTNESFAGKLLVGSNSNVDCNVSGGSGNQLANATCFYGAGTATPPTSTVADLTSTFASAIVTVNDPANPSAPQTNGVIPFANITDWVNFISPYRGWLLSGSGGFLDPSHNNACTAGNCLLYDSRLKAGSPYVDYFGAFPASAGQPCPASVDGSIAANIITDANGTYLKNAFEWLGSGTGNGDGLCNSGEMCIYAGNIGGYPGEASPGVPLQSCVFTSGAVSGVTMLGYPIRGI